MRCNGQPTWKRISPWTARPAVLLPWEALFRWFPCAGSRGSADPGIERCPDWPHCHQALSWSRVRACCSDLRMAPVLDTIRRSRGSVAASAISRSLAPVAGSSPAMSNSENADFFGKHEVHNRVWKALESFAACCRPAFFTEGYRIGFGCVLDTLQCALDRRQETGPSSESRASYQSIAARSSSRASGSNRIALIHDRAAWRWLLRGPKPNRLAATVRSWPALPGVQSLPPTLPRHPRPALHPCWPEAHGLALLVRRWSS